MENSRRSKLLTYLITLLCLLLYAGFAYELDRSEFPKLIGVVAILFLLSWRLIKTPGLNFWYLVGFGSVARLIFIVALPNLSQDFYRFLWDGRLLIQGINPYLVTPASYMASGDSIVPQAAILFEGMGGLNAGHFSNYPPLNQLFFGVAALFSGKDILGSVVVLRLLMIAADVGILFFGRKILAHLNLPVQNIFWYFLNPFIIIELTGNLHFEGVMLFFFLLGVYLLLKGKWMVAAFCVGASISVKLIPLIFLPIFLKYFLSNQQHQLNFSKLIGFYGLVGLTVTISFLPFASQEFLSNFLATIALWFNDFEFNASVHYLIRWASFKWVGWNLIYITGKIMSMVVLLVVIGMALFRSNNNIKSMAVTMLFAISFYLLLSTTVHPWYVATPLLLCLFTNYRFPILWSLLVMVSYSAYGKDGFDEKLWLIAIEYLLLFAFFIWEFRRFRSQDSKTESESSKHLNSMI